MESTNAIIKQLQDEALEKSAKEALNKSNIDAAVCFKNGIWATIIDPELPKTLKQAIEEIGKAEMLRILNDPNYAKRIDEVDLKSNPNKL